MRFELATPTRMLVSTEAEEVVAPGVEGYFGVLPGHAAFLTTLAAGEVMYRTGQRQEYLAVAGGFAEVRAERVIILAEHAERPEEIDRERAERARQRAEMRLQGRSPTGESEEIDFARALEALARALTPSASIRIRSNVSAPIRWTARTHSGPGTGACHFALTPHHTTISLLARRWQSQRAMTTILVVDDEPPIVDLVRFTLEDADVRVVEAADGAEALVVARQTIPDLVLLDVHMPRLDGFEVCRQLRREPSLARIPIVMLTAAGQESDRARGRAAGADEYLTKPFSPLALLALVEALVPDTRSWRPM